MSGLQRTTALSVAAFGMAGIAAGLLVQVARSTSGHAPLVPPLSLSLTLLVLAGVLLTLGIALRRAVHRTSQRPVNPFHAVRLLAGAKAGQFSGALLGGFGAGLVLQLFTRSVMAPTATWMPMVMVFGAGVVLVTCGAIAESLCQVPPTDPDDTSEGADGRDPEPEADAA